jgi:hypothetical protein
MATTSDPEHLTGDVLRLGVVAAVDPGGATCMVESGDVVAGPLPWVAWRAGGLRVWAPPSVGEQCLVLSPEGIWATGLCCRGSIAMLSRRRLISLILSVLLSPMGRGSAMIRCAMRWLSRCPQGAPPRSMRPVG